MTDEHKLEWLGGPIESCRREGHAEEPRAWCQDCQRAGRVPARSLEEAFAVWSVWGA